MASWRTSAAGSTPSAEARQVAGRHALLATALLLLAAGPLCADEDLPRGQVIERVVSLRDPGQSYALYLPSAYEARGRWPILYCFDPRGNGIQPVLLFQAAAEKHGWIVAGSNNSRNGPWKDIYEAAWALWEDTRARLRLDDTRLYAAGFSGGARVACGLGRILETRTAGVLGCGAGLPEWLAAADLGVPWFGTAGDKDFNLGEMKKLEGELTRLGSPCRRRVFPGQHAWPPVEIAEEAIDWLAQQTSSDSTKESWW